MTRRLFVCHATADIEATSELVDALENALSFSAGSLWTSSLPGYSADPNDMPALGAALAGSDVVLALVTQTSVQDAQFHFQLGAGWALGAHTVLFVLEAEAMDALPNALNQATIMRGHAPSQWSELIGDLSVRLGLVPRPGASTPPVLTPSSPPPAPLPKSAPPPPAAVPSVPRIPSDAALYAAPIPPPAPAALRGAAELSDAYDAEPADEAAQPLAASAEDTDVAYDDEAELQAAAAFARGGRQSVEALDSDDDLDDEQTEILVGATLKSAGPHATAQADAALPSAATAGSFAAEPADDAAPASAATTGSHATAQADAALPNSATAGSFAAAQADVPRANAAGAVPADSKAAAQDDAARASAASAPDGSHAAPLADATRVARQDQTPLPAAVAKIANASARPPGAVTALNTAGAQIAAAKAQQPGAAKPVSVPPLPGASPARPASVPPLTAAAAQAPRTVGVPPLPAAVIVPPPPAGQAARDDGDVLGEPTTTPKAPIIVLTAIPEPEPEPAAAQPKTDPKPQPRAAGAYPSVAPTQSYLDELRAITPDPAERTPPRYSFIDELEPLDPEDYAAAESGYEALPAGEEDDEPDTREQLRVGTRPDEAAAAEQASDSDVFARLPTCEMALEAGRAVSDCLFNRDEIDNFAIELDAPLGSLIESLGASWVELRAEQDLDTWVAVTDHLLLTLPDEVRKLEEWYRVGFELATLHNLAGQLVLDGSDAAAELHWRGALERFLMRAERAEIGYENLGRVLGLLENLVGPSHERDLSNIPRSLEELRRYAAGADIHTAA